MQLYYIFKEIGSEKDSLVYGPRVLCYPPDYIFRFPNGDADGPFTSISDLKKGSDIYKGLIKSNPKRAQQIFEPNFIVNVRRSIPVDQDVHDDLQEHIYKIISHTIGGDIKKGNSSGIHYYEPGFNHRLRILKQTKAFNDKGLWEAKIALLNINTGKWVEKEDPSTFFPFTWDTLTLTRKIREAYNNKEKLSDIKYVGTTGCGIKIEFIFREGKLATLYPLYE